MTTTVNTAGSVPYPGQWRLARVDMANWGTFNGFQSLPVDRRGLLITGPSGSGKSTVLDAVAAVLTPPTQLSLNAAASNGGQRDKGRSISNYVRGACGHSADEEGEVVHTYLRPKAAVWSGVMLRYEDGFDIEQCSPPRRPCAQLIRALRLERSGHGSIQQGSQRDGTGMERPCGVRRIPMQYFAHQQPENTHPPAQDASRQKHRIAR